MVVKAYGIWVLTWSRWSHDEAMLDMTVVSLMGEQWSPKIAPSSTAAAAKIVRGKPPKAWARGTTVGMRMAMVVQEVPMEKATTEASRKMSKGSKRGEIKGDKAAVR